MFSIIALSTINCSAVAFVKMQAIYDYILYKSICSENCATWKIRRRHFKIEIIARPEMPRWEEPEISSFQRGFYMKLWNIHQMSRLKEG